MILSIIRLGRAINPPSYYWNFNFHNRHDKLNQCPMQYVCIRVRTVVTPVHLFMGGVQQTMLMCCAPAQSVSTIDAYIHTSKYCMACITHVDKTITSYVHTEYVNIYGYVRTSTTKQQQRRRDDDENNSQFCNCHFLVVFSRTCPCFAVFCFQLYGNPGEGFWFFEREFIKTRRRLELEPA